MSEKCCKCNWIILGKIDKYALLLLLQACLIIASSFVIDESKITNYITLYSPIIQITYQLGSSLSFFVLIFYCIRNKRKNLKMYRKLIKSTIKNEIGWIKKILWILLVAIVDYITIFIDYIIIVKKINNYGFFRCII